jgi:hypothetical protein
MTCGKYKNALLLAATTNGELDAKLARHLERCSQCLTTLRSDRELFSRIDSALRVQVNEDPRPGFLAQLRVQLWKELTSRPGSNRAWHVAGAALALVLIAMFYPLINPRQPRIHRDLQTPGIRVPQSAGLVQSARADEESRVRSRQYSKRPAIQGAVRQEPEVLVPPDEEKAFAQFVGRVAGRDAMAEAVVSPAVNNTANRNTELREVPSVDIADLQWDRARQEEWINQTGGSE